MADVNGKPFLHYLLKYWAPYINTFVLAAGYGAEHIKNYFGDSFENSKLVYSHCVHGTQQAIEKSLPGITEKTCFVLNGDTIFEVYPVEMQAFHDKSGATLTLGYSTMLGIHGGVDIMSKQFIVPRGTIYSSGAPFIDIGTPDQLSLFRLNK